MIARLSVEWGFGSETYDFAYWYVDIDEQDRITKVYDYTHFYGWLKWTFAKQRKDLDYGYGYDRRQLLHDDLSRKKTSLTEFPRRGRAIKLRGGGT